MLYTTIFFLNFTSMLTYTSSTCSIYIKFCGYKLIYVKIYVRNYKLSGIPKPKKNRFEWEEQKSAFPSCCNSVSVSLPTVTSCLSRSRKQLLLQQLENLVFIPPIQIAISRFGNIKSLQIWYTHIFYTSSVYNCQFLKKSDRYFSGLVITNRLKFGTLHIFLHIVSLQL